MQEILISQKTEWNTAFGKFHMKITMRTWIKVDESHCFHNKLTYRKTLFQNLRQHQPTLLIVIDNLRYDQWKTILPVVK